MPKVQGEDGTEKYSSSVMNSLLIAVAAKQTQAVRQCIH